MESREKKWKLLYSKEYYGRRYNLLYEYRPNQRKTYYYKVRAYTELDGKKTMLETIQIQKL